MQKVITTLLLVFLVGTSLQAQNAESIARDHMNNDWKAKSLVQSDVQGARISDSVPTNTGLHHVYFRQEHAGIPVHAGIYNVSVYNGDVVFSGSSFISDLAGRAGTTSASLSADDAINRVMSHISANPSDLSLVSTAPNVAIYSAASISSNDIKAELMYMEIDGQVRLGWGMTVWSLTSDSSPYVYVDANNGSIVYERNMTINDNWLPADHKTATADLEVAAAKSIPYAFAKALPNRRANDYTVYNWPVESPNHSAPPNPADGRTIVATTGDPTASPLGWHDDGTLTYETTQGNNVDAQKGGVEADCGATLDCNVALDLTLDPTAATNVDAAIINLFYWNNLIHDVFWHYGFDEVGGNFQEVNAGGGIGSDYVIANAQAPGNCNANMSTPPDGGNATMNMFNCDIATPTRDGDFDNGVVVHEYGHGISLRMVGGPATTSCLSNSEQAGEGYGDLWGLWLTMEPGDAGTDSRGIGTWLLGTGPGGPGVRTQPYSTNMAVNNHTYEDVNSAVVPHGVGEVFATVLWDVAWEFVSQIPYDADIPSGSGGNNVFMEIYMDALQMMPCNGSQLDVRDAFMAALDTWNAANGDAVDACSVWANAWGPRGYGADAIDGGTARGDEVNGFAMPNSCLLEVIVTMSAAPDPIMAGEDLTITIDALNNTAAGMTNVVISDVLTSPSFSFGGDNLVPVGYVSDTCGVGSAPGGTWTWTIPSLAAGVTASCDLIVSLPATPFSNIIFQDDQTTATNWTPSNNSPGFDWVHGTLGPTSPGSGGNNWFATDVNVVTDQYLDLNAAIDGPELTVLHNVNTESGFDGGVIEVSTNGGGTWVDVLVAGGSFVANGYNGPISSSFDSPIGGRDAFSGNLGWIETIIDVSGVTLQSVPLQVRFRLATDNSVSSVGWTVDDVFMGTTVTLCNGADGSSTETGVGIAGALLPCPVVIANNLPVELTSFRGLHADGNITLDWNTASEENNSGFDVELRLAGEGWQTVGYVEGNGTTETANSYSFTQSDLKFGMYSARLKQIDFDGAFEYSNVIEILVPLPYDYQLGDAYPNPFNPTAKFELIVAEQQNVRVELYDMTGRKVKTLFDGMVEANTSRPIKIDGSLLPSGSYIYRAIGETFTTPSKSLVLLK